MKLNQRLASLLVTTMVLTSVPQVAMASDYNNHWAAGAINKWKDKGIISGFEDGTFRPKEEITKAQFSKILVEIFGYTETEGSKQYSDVSTDKWYSEYISKVSAAGIMYEEGTVFKPNTAITREEAAYALAQAYKITKAAKQNKGFKDEAEISAWALEAVTALHEAGYIQGTPEGNFNPKGLLTRAEIITMIDRMNSEVINVKGTYSKDIEGNLVVNTRDVVLKDMTISGNLYLAEGIGDGDIDLENVTVKGKVFIEGGGINSIKSKNCTYQESLQVSAKNPVRVVIQGEGVRIEALEGTKVTLTGSFKEVSVAQDVNMTIKDAKVDVVVIAQGTTNDGTEPKIEIAAGSEVGKIQADIAADITGSGKVGELIANANDVKIEQKPEKVTIGEKDVVIQVAGQEQTQSSTTTKPSTSTGGSSSSSDSSNSNSSSGTLAPTYRVSGTVYAEQKVGDQLKDVAEGATIQFYEVTNNSSKYITTIYTDEKGAYSINLNSAKTYRIEAWLNDGEGNGYFYSGTINNLRQNLNGHNFTLKQHPVANITVVDLDGRPIKDVKIVPVMNGKEDGWSYTDFTGNETRYLWGNDETTFNFNFYLGDTMVTLPQELQDIVVGEVKEKYDYKVDLRIVLPYRIPSVVEGTIVSEQGEALANYKVHLVKRRYSTDGSSKWVEETVVRTDSYGRFIFEGIETSLKDEEYYELSVASRDTKGNSYNADNRSLSLYALQANGNKLQVKQTYGVIVKVIDKDGKPIKSADVTLNGVTSDGRFGYRTNTNNQGVADIHATYIKPGNHILTVEYNGQSVVTNVQMTEGTYNYEQTIQLKDVSLSGKVARLKVYGQSITVGDKEIKATQVGIDGPEGGYWADLDANGEATIVLPESYNEDLTLYVAGANGERLYSEKISMPDTALSKTINLDDTVKYSLSGQITHRTTEGAIKVTTGASIQVKMHTWSEYPNTLVATATTTQQGYSISNLVGSSPYIIVVRYEEDGVEYIGRKWINEKRGNQSEDVDNVNLQLRELVKINIKFQDINGNPMSIWGVDLADEPYRTDINGKIVFEAGVGTSFSCDLWEKYEGKKYEVKQIINNRNNEVILGKDIVVEKDMDITVVVE